MTLSQGQHLSENSSKPSPDRFWAIYHEWKTSLCCGVYNRLFENVLQSHTGVESSLPEVHRNVCGEDLSEVRIQQHTGEVLSNFQQYMEEPSQRCCGYYLKRVHTDIDCRKKWRQCLLCGSSQHWLRECDRYQPEYGQFNVNQSLLNVNAPTFRPRNVI